MDKKNRDKKNNDIIITSIGGQSEHVTGSMTLVEYKKEDNTRGCILLEMGGIQLNSNILEEYNANKKLLESLPIEKIDYVFVCHSHQDHEMHLPYLETKNSKAKIIMTKENLNITRQLLPDSTFIHSKNIEYLRNKGHKVSPFYTDRECNKVFDRIQTYEEDKIYELEENVSFRFRSNSHTVGATQLELFIKKNSGQKKKIVYTSDLGSTINKDFQYFLEDNYQITKADLLLIESTYGANGRSFTKKECIKEREELEQIINDYVLKNKNNCLIPCFSYGRLQNMMCMIYEKFKDSWNMDIPIVIDTALGNDINLAYDRILKGKALEYWLKVKGWKAFKYIRDYKGTIAFLSKKQNALVLSSSGMINGGHSLIYAKQFLGHSNDIICFCGYCAPNTIGGKILDDNKKTILIEKETLLKKCTIKKFKTFSSHAQQEDLINYILNINCNKIILHHGDEVAKNDLKEKLIEKLSKKGKTAKIECSYRNMKIKL